MSLSDQVRTSCEAVMAQADFVTIVPGRLAALAPVYDALVETLADRVGKHAVRRSPAAGDEPRVVLVLALDAINFGSGYHDVIRKDPGLSGARSMASRLRRYVEATGPLTAVRLNAITASDCAQIFGQELDGGALEELLVRYQQALNDLGHWLVEAHGGSAIDAVRAADRSAIRLAESLLAMPFYRDVETVDGADGPIEVSFYKRAQISAADLERECGPGLFDDLDQLTAFADNLVPHVLRVDGALTYRTELADRIDAGCRLEPGSRPEVEIRAAGVVAVEHLVALTGHRAMDLDLALWQRGSGPPFKALPRHRARSVFY